MDIDLLSKMVKELILDNDKVVLPGLGAFVAEIVPATFSDKGFTINPPYRKLYFRAKPDEGSALAEFYASSNKINIDIAEKVIGDFVAELKSVLFTRKTVVFPGLGRLRATKENAVFFVADEDLDIYPEGFALEPISLKTHVETQAEVAAVVGNLKAIVADVIEEPEEAPAVEVPAEVEVPEVIEVLEEMSESSEEVSESSEEVTEEPEVEQEEQETESDAESTDESPAGPEQIEDVAEQEAEQIEDVTEPEAEQEGDVTEPEAEQEGEKAEAEESVAVQKKKPSFWKIFAKTLMWLVITTVVLLAAYIIVARFAPDMMDKILYTPEELEIINR